REPGRIHGISFDITEAKLTQLRLGEQVAVSTAIVASLGEGTIAIDVDGNVTFINEAAADLLACTPHESLGKHSTDIASVETGVGEHLESPLLVAMRTSRCIRGDDDWIVRADGSRFSASYTAAPIRRDGLVTGAVLAF